MNSSTDPRPDPAKVRKFAYETVFSAQGEILRDGSGFRTQFSRDELEKARADAFEEGCRAGHAEVAEALAALIGSMDRLASSANDPMQSRWPQAHSQIGSGVPQ